MLRVVPVAERLFTAPGLQRFFDPQHYLNASNELEISDVSGVVYRIDRVVEQQNAVWVLDYKSSGSTGKHLDRYMAQVTNYCQVLKEVYPWKAVRGVLVFSDATIIEVNNLV